MLLDKVLKLIGEYLGVEDYYDINENTNIMYEFNLDEDQLEELADLLTEETGRYVSADMFEATQSIGELVEEMEDY